jgi:hypothetical protein
VSKYTNPFDEHGGIWSKGRYYPPVKKNPELSADPAKFLDRAANLPVTPRPPVKPLSETERAQFKTDWKAKHGWDPEPWDVAGVEALRAQNQFERDFVRMRARKPWEMSAGDLEKWKREWEEVFGRAPLPHEIARGTWREK